MLQDEADINSLAAYFGQTPDQYRREQARLYSAWLLKQRIVAGKLV